MSALAITTDSRLDELSAIVRREHAATRRVIAEMVEHAISAGEALIEARAHIDDEGGW
jgi:hypothetical protein